jgi:hypothetical protein
LGFYIGTKSLVSGSLKLSCLTWHITGTLNINTCCFVFHNSYHPTLSRAHAHTHTQNIFRNFKCHCEKRAQHCLRTLLLLATTGDYQNWCQNCRKIYIEFKKQWSVGVSTKSFALCTSMNSSDMWCAVLVL